MKSPHHCLCSRAPHELRVFKRVKVSAFEGKISEPLRSVKFQMLSVETRRV